VNVPICLAAIVLAWRKAPSSPPSPQRKPLVSLAALRIRSYAAACAVLFLAGLSLYGPLLLLALYYQQIQGKSVIITGLLLVPQGVGSLVPRTIAGTLAYTQAGPHTSQWLLAASLLVRGAGLAGVTIAVMAGAFQGVLREEVPDAASTTRIVLQVGGSFGAAVLAVILAHEFTHEVATAAAHATAFNIAFWWSIGFSVLALVPAFLLPSKGAKETAA
jgi:hypothetical protein